MNRSEARRIGRQMVRSRRFHSVELVEDLTTGAVRIEAMNACWNKRTVRIPQDWVDLRESERLTVR